MTSYTDQGTIAIEPAKVAGKSAKAARHPKGLMKILGTIGTVNEKDRPYRSLLGLMIVV